tara:strand:+ start:1534 stop:1806 length:273 start_codon:yes stop_codon:yes gene_type:complete
MTIQDLQNLDLYNCSLQDINKAFKSLSVYVDSLISKGHSTSNNFKGSDKYNTAKKLHVLISRARLGMDSKGKMLGYNVNSNRLSNNKSIL